MNQKRILELEEERLTEIKRLNEEYARKKEEAKKQSYTLEDFSFEIITDAKMTINGIRYAKRKAVFLHHLNTYFDIKSIEDIEEVKERKDISILDALNTEDSE